MVRETSIQTYNDLKDDGDLPTARSDVLIALQFLGEATDQEISKHLGSADPNRVRPRRKELLDAGLVEDAGIRQCKVTGRAAHQWRLTSPGRTRKEAQAELAIAPKPQRSEFCLGCGRPLKAGQLSLCAFCALEGQE